MSYALSLLPGRLQGFVRNEDGAPVAGTVIDVFALEPDEQEMIPLTLPPVTSAVEVIVTDPVSEEPVSGVIVSLLDDNGVTLDTALTTQRGSVALPDVAMGEYTVVTYSPDLGWTDDRVIALDEIPTEVRLELPNVPPSTYTFTVSATDYGTSGFRVRASGNGS